MPSRRRSGRRSGRRSHKGRKQIKRSLRVSPKLVIKERADTIQDTINATMGRTSFRIPEDVSNIIQDYEGLETVYFNFDPILKKFVLSTNTPLPGGGKTYINTDIHNYRGQVPFTYFAEIEIQFPYKNKFIRRKVLFVGITDRQDVKYGYASQSQTIKMLEDYVLEKYYKKVYLDHINSLKNTTIDESELPLEMSIRTYIKKTLDYPFEIEENNHNKIIFEKLV